MKPSHLYAFLGGLLAGGVAALLLAPDKGSETRRKIVSKVKEGGEYTKEQIENLLAHLKGQAANGISDLEEEILDLEEKLIDIESKLRKK